MASAEPPRSSSERIARVKQSRYHSFTLNDTDEEVPRLLRNVADVIEELGDVTVRDLTYCLNMDSPDPETRITVYVVFDEENE